MILILDLLQCTRTSPINHVMNNTVLVTIVATDEVGEFRNKVITPYNEHQGKQMQVGRPCLGLQR